MGKVVKGLSELLGFIPAFITGGPEAGLRSLINTATFLANPTLLTGTMLVGKALISSFVDKPPSARMDNAIDRLHISINPQALGKWVFGETAFPGDIVYAEQFGTNKDRILYIIAGAAHRIESFGNFYVNDELISFSGDGATGAWADTLWKRTKTGAPGQTHIGNSFGGGTNSLPASFIGENTAYYGLVLRAGQTKTEAGLPTRYTQVVKGAPVYDPRLDTTVGGSGSHRANDQTTWQYTAGGVDLGANAALVILFYLLGWRTAGGALIFGMGVDPADIDYDAFMAAATVCDETLDGKRRYRIGGVLDLSQEHEQIISQLEAAVGAKIGKFGGKYTVWVAHDDLTPYSSITEADLLREAGVEFMPAGPIETLFNTSRGRYIEPAQLYQAIEYPEVIETTAVTEDGRSRVMAHDFALVQDQSIAERVVRQLIRRSRFTATWKFALGPKGLLFKPFSVTTLNIQETNFEDVTVRITNMQYGMNGMVAIECVEEDSSIYDTTAALGTPVTQLDPPAYDPSSSINVAGLTSADIAYPGAAGSVVEALKVSWSDPGGYVAGTEIQYRVAGAADWSNVPASAVDFLYGIITPVMPGTTYDIRARHVTLVGVAGAWSQIADTAGTSSLVQTMNGYSTTRSWNLQASKYGMQSTNCTLTPGNDYLTLNATGASPVFWLEPGFTKLVKGKDGPLIRMRVKRTAGTGWVGKFRWKNAAHTYQDANSLTISDNTVTGQWVIIQWDVRTVGDYATTDILGLEFALGATSADDFQIEWIVSGTVDRFYAPSDALYNQLSNHLPVGYGDFEKIPVGDASFFSASLNCPNPTVQAANPFAGANSLQLSNTGGVGTGAYFADTVTDYNIPLAPNRRWIVTARVRTNTATAHNWGAQLVLSDATLNGPRAVKPAGAINTYIFMAWEIDLTAKSQITGLLRIYSTDIPTTLVANIDQVALYDVTEYTTLNDVNFPDIWHQAAGPTPANLIDALGTINAPEEANANNTLRHMGENVDNPDFEAGPFGWTMGEHPAPGTQPSGQYLNDNSKTRRGDWCLELLAVTAVGSTYCFNNYQMSCEEGSSVAVRLWIYRTNAGSYGPTPAIKFFDKNGNYVTGSYLSSYTTQSVWEFKEAKFIVPTGSGITSCALAVAGSHSSNPSTGYIDGASLERASYEYAPIFNNGATVNNEFLSANAGMSASEIVLQAGSGSVRPANDGEGEVGTVAKSFSNGRFVNFTVEQSLTVAGSIDLSDNDVINLGLSDDTTIKHDGANTIVDHVGTGTLFIKKAGATKITLATDGIDITGDVGGTTIGGITEANLVDKTANETITGTWVQTGKPAFYAQRITTDQTDVTGASPGSSAVTVVFNSTRFDQGSNFNTGTGIFSAPETGKYLLTASVRVSGITTACTQINMQIITSNQGHFMKHDAKANSEPDDWTMTNSVVVDMDAGDTAEVRIEGFGEASNVHDIKSGSGFTYFSGSLIA